MINDQVQGWLPPYLAASLIEEGPGWDWEVT